MKLHAKQLRIGNYVYEEYWNSATRKFEYSLIEINSIRNTSITCQDYSIYNIEDLRPIPLIEYWLLRFKEIQRIDEGLFSIDGERYIELTLKGDGYNVDLGGIVICFVDTVHALQNAVFVILGKELTLIK